MIAQVLQDEDVLPVVSWAMRRGMLTAPSACGFEPLARKARGGSCCW